MKYIIKENQCGLVMKDGKLQRILFTGKYYLSRISGYQVHIENMERELEFCELPYQCLLEKKELAERTIHVIVPEGYIALLYEDGILVRCLTKSEYVFWRVYHEYEYQLLSMEQPRLEKSITKRMLDCIPNKYYTLVEVAAGHQALLYFDETLQEVLQEGVYYYWNYTTRVTAKLYDMRRQQITISGQEILTADKVAVRVNIVCVYWIKDIKGIAATFTSLEDMLYTKVQLLVKECVSKYKLDEILEQKAKCSEEILEALQMQQEKYYIACETAGIKDIILPGEVRDILNTVLLAEKKAQADVITRREEVASTRSLLNTAKLMEENKTLYRLKELEYMERICQTVDQIKISGASNVLEQLQTLLQVK